MTRKRLIVAGASAGLALLLGTGLAAAQGDGTTTTRPVPMGTMHTGDHDAMHEQMRTQMPDGLAAQCDEARASMGDDHG